MGTRAHFHTKLQDLLVAARIEDSRHPLAIAIVNLQLEDI